MIAALENFWALRLPAAETGPKPPRRHAPVLMGDILMARGGEPELLIRWREDSALDRD